MKHGNTNEEIATTIWKDSECEELILTSIAEVHDLALQKAEDLAEAKLPSMSDDLHSYTSWITSKCNDLKSKVLAKLNVFGLKARGASIVERYAKREAELKEKVTELSSMIRDTKKEVAKVNAEDILAAIRKWRLVHPFIILLIIIEALALEQAMGMLSSLGILVRGMIAGGVCMSTYFLAKKHVILARNTVSTLGRVGVNVGMFALAAVVFLLFGMLRMSYLTEMDEEMAQRSNEYMFGAVSMVFYLGCVLATSMYMPTMEDRKYSLVYLQKKLELARMEKEVKEAQDELDALPSDRERDLYKIFSIFKVSESYLEQVDFSYESVIGEFISHVNIKRHDGRIISLKQYRGGVIPPLTQYEFKTESL